MYETNRKTLTNGWLGLIGSGSGLIRRVGYVILVYAHGVCQRCYFSNVVGIATLGLCKLVWVVLYVLC